MSIFFVPAIFSSFFSWTPRQCCVLLFLHAQFSIETSGALFTFLAMRLFRTFKIKRGTKYGFYLVYGTCYFIFRVAASNYDKSFLKHSYRKETRWWCAHDAPIVFFLFWLIIMVSLLIPRFLLPALRYILFVSGSLWFAARCSMIGYFSRSSLFLILCSLLTSLSYWGEGGGKC